MSINKVTQKDLDLIRIEAEAIKSTDDKYFLMERLHKYIETIETQLENFDYATNSIDSNQNRDKLLNLQNYAQEIRQYIMNQPVGPRRYGLFIEYPDGYKG